MSSRSSDQTAGGLERRRSDAERHHYDDNVNKNNHNDTREVGHAQYDNPDAMTSLDAKQHHSPPTPSEKPAQGSFTDSGQAGKKSRGWKIPLPPWLSTALKDGRKWRVFVRAVVVLTVMLILLVDTQTLNAMGNAAFFGLIILCILPPMFPLSIFLFVITTIVVGMCVGWAWSVAAMASALSARDAGRTALQEQGVLGALPAGESQTTGLQVAVFHGSFLQPASTGIFALFFFLGTYALGSARALAPKLAPAVIFATIVMDVMCSYGPLFPSAQYTLAKTFLIPTAFYVAVALAATVSIFPETVNHSLLAGFGDGFLGAASKLFALQDRVLVTGEDEPGWIKTREGSAALRKGMIGAIGAIEGGLKMLELEVSYGRTSAADIKLLVAKGTVLGGRLIGYSGFQVIIDDTRKRNKVAQDYDPGSGTEQTEKHETSTFATHHVANRLRKEHLDREQSAGHSFGDLAPVLEACSARLRQLCGANLANGMATLHGWNESRWSKLKDDNFTKRSADLVELKREIEDFRTQPHAELLKPFAYLFDKDSGRLTRERSERDAHIPVQGLHLCFVYCTSLIGFAEALRDFMQAIDEIHARNPSNKLQLPTKFVSKAGAALTSKGNDALDRDIATGEDEDKTDEPVSKRGRSSSRDPDAETPRNGLQRFTKKLSGLWRWQSSDNGIFALRYATVSILLWLPAVMPSSAWFNYEYKGLWALIMAQTGAGILSGEQIVGFIQRCAGTIIGLVLGMLAWYLGSGSEYSGNAYGVVAATTVITMPFLYLRMVAPQKDMAVYLMIAVTINFVVGYSWVNAHVVQVGNVGVGYSLAWKRALLVLIGFAAAFIIALFPRPSSAKRQVRSSLAKSISRVTELYLEEVSDLLEEARAVQFGVKGYDIAAKSLSHRTHFLQIAGRLQGLDSQVGMASFEPALRGPWPRKKYETLTHHTFVLLATLAQLNAAWTRLDPRWAKRFVDRSPFLEPAFISDSLSALSLASYALRNGQPLPPVVSLEERLALNFRDRKGRARVSRRAGETEGLHQLEAELGVNLTWDSIHDEQVAIYATCSVSLARTVMHIDLVLEDVKGLVGENEFQQLRDRERELADRNRELDRNV